MVVIGGEQIYREALPRARRLYLTEVHADVDGDAVLPSMRREEWREVSRERHDASESNPYDYSFVVLEIIWLVVEPFMVELMHSLKILLLD